MCTRPKALCRSKTGVLNKAKALCRLQRTRLAVNLAHKVRTTFAPNGAQQAHHVRTRLSVNLAHNPPCTTPSLGRHKAFFSH